MGFAVCRQLKLSHIDIQIRCSGMNEYRMTGRIIAAVGPGNADVLHSAVGRGCCNHTQCIQDRGIRC